MANSAKLRPAADIAELQELKRTRRDRALLQVQTSRTRSQWRSSLPLRVGRTSAALFVVRLKEGVEISGS